MQIRKLHPFAFPLAEVTVAVAAMHQDFLPIVLSKLHQVRNACSGQLFGCAWPAHVGFTSCTLLWRDSTGAFGNIDAHMSGALKGH